MEQHEVAGLLAASAKEIGLYKAGIEQKREEKESLQSHKDTLASNINFQKNKGKATRVNIGKIEQKYQDELDKLERIQQKRCEVMEEAEAVKAYNMQTNAEARALKNYKEELAGRVRHELQLIETLNKIVQKLNFERSEEEHQAKVQRVELTSVQKLRQSVQSSVRTTKTEGKSFYQRA